MKSLTENLKVKFEEATKKAFPNLESPVIEISQSKQDKFGHYQFNSAMKMTKLLGENPRKIAEQILGQVETGDLIEKMEIAGPGFINITLKDSFLSNGVQVMATDSHLGIDLPENKQRVIVEFSSPNIAKQLHVGHLRSTIIGDCIARLFEFLGHDVLRLNHIGDWGTAFGMLIAYLKEEKPDILSGKEGTDLNHLVEWYRASKKQFDEDPDFKKRSQLEVVALQSLESKSVNAWELICEISRKAFVEIYDLLDIRQNERGESFYNPMLPGIIEDFEKKDLIRVSNGAKCVFMDGFINREGEPLPMIIQKSDGGFNYETTDVAALKHRIEDEKADRIIVLTDLGQSLHFQMVFKACELAGYYDPERVRVDHVTFGLVLGADGKKFRTRAGDTEPLIDLLTTAIEKADQVLQERKPEMPEDQRHELAESIGIGAVKYADLSCSRTGDYTFSYDRMLRFEGNTAAFLMYAYVRVAGIKRKIGADIEEVRKNGKISLEHPSEVALGLHLLRFTEVLNQVANDLLPNRLCEYLFELAGKFNAFYRDCPVGGSKEQDSRLLLCETVALTMQKGLHILGVETVEKM